MSLIDVLFYIFAAVCAVALIALAVAVLAMIAITIGSLWSMYGPQKPRFEAETPFGRFSKHGGGDWESTDEEKLSITVNDRDGVPDPKFIDGLPELIADLPALEALAREAYDFETAKEMSGFEGGAEPFVMSALMQGSGDEEFILVFGADDDAYDLGSVFVAFAGGRVVDTTLVH